MASYLVKKEHKDEKVVSFKEYDGYVFKPKLNKEQFIKVNSIKIVDAEMIDRILTMKFNKSFNRLVALAMAVLNDDDADDSDCEIVLDEAQLVREILLNRYQKFLSQKKEELFLKKLRIIENEIRMKQVKVKQRAQFLEVLEEKSKGRGR